MLMRTWKEQLQSQLIEKYGKQKGTVLSKQYMQAFSPGYIDEYPPSFALNDISFIERLNEKHPLEIYFYISPEKEHPLHLRLFQWQKPIPLSDILPMLENFDLRTFNERPHQINLVGKEHVWLSDFAVVYSKANFDIEQIRDLFQDAFISIYKGLSENDGFNKLILSANVSWREVMVLRAYTKYLRQVSFPFSQSYIEKTLANNATIAKNLIELFLVLHNPTKADKEVNIANKIEKDILEALDAVTSLDEDRIIRRFLALLKATLRTNYFQPNAKGEPKTYLAFKFSSKSIPELPLPTPLYEIFVYSTRFEGIHLRNAKVARGGIRWSERLEDFRTEILGLMKAQIVKNAVIVPSGAKGGFVLKTETISKTREALQAEVVACYKFFISGLLDITDNIYEKKTVHPPHVVCYDDFDPYLVVAADRGTASFSDLANEISKSYKFWLGDAFASGGSTGYDHKKIGITARGTWESIKRHFRTLNINVEEEDITVIGIGDMGGDVFGNGMLYTKHLKLIAAFDHRHIFIDPTPDAEVSYHERLRIFNLPVSTWEDYNPKLISKGGGVFKRSAKSIDITPQMKKALAIEDQKLTPNDLIRAILKAPVDLFYNGGIGTYVKASIESQTDVGDRTNDACRVNGGELRCKVVGEGGNLGFTQLGRVQYALSGGLINTDSIDNSGGVDCSDHEVNLKILLDQQVHAKKLSEKKRNELLAEVTDQVAELVLKDNFEQAMVMSYSNYRAKKNISLHTDYIKELEHKGILDREVEHIPDEKKLIERKAAGDGLTSPELAVLLSYSKIDLKQELLKTKLPEDPYLSKVVAHAFPPSIHKKYVEAMKTHRLHREIIATQLSNQIVNEMGITFIYRLQIETSATVGEIACAYITASHVFESIKLENLIKSLDFKISMQEQYDMLFNIRNLVNLATRWFLRSHYLNFDLEKLIAHFSERVKILEKITPNLMAGATKEYLHTLIKEFINIGLSESIARRIATYRAIYTSLNIIDVATVHNLDLIKTAKVYYACGEQINLLWFRDQIAKDSRDGHWNILARLSLRDELDSAQRNLTIAIMQTDKKEKDPGKLISKWMQANQRALERWEALLSMLLSSSEIDYTMFFIAMRELISLTISSNIQQKFNIA